MQILPNSTLGGSLGASLGTGLNDLAQLKLAQLTKQYDIQNERNQFAEGLAPLLGQDTARFLSNLSPQERNHALQNIGSLMQLNEPTGAAQEASNLGLLTSPQQMTNEPINQQPRMTPERSKLIQDIFTSPQEKREREKLELKKQQISSAEKVGAFKETKAERAAIVNEAKAAKDSLARLDRMNELNKTGKLNSPLYIEFLKKTGFDIPALTTPDSQEFRKLEVDFLRDAKNIFGARVTNYEAAQFLKSIPSLSQSKEGREKVIQNLRIMNEAKLARADTLRKILKENNGVPPLDLAEQIEDRISPKIDKLHEQFVRGLQSKIETSFNDLPAAEKYNGRKIRDRKTGKILQSNGQEWLPME